MKKTRVFIFMVFAFLYSIAGIAGGDIIGQMVEAGDDFQELQRVYREGLQDHTVDEAAACVYIHKVVGIIERHGGGDFYDQLREDIEATLRADIIRDRVVFNLFLRELPQDVFRIQLRANDDVDYGEGDAFGDEDLVPDPAAAGGAAAGALPPLAAIAPPLLLPAAVVAVPPPPTGDADGDVDMVGNAAEILLRLRRGDYHGAGASF